MFMLRLLSVLAAGLVLIAAPVTLDPRGHGMPGWIALGCLFATALIACSFLYIALAARRMRRDPSERKLGALLLLIPAVCALATIATAKDTQLLTSSGVLLGFTVLVMATVLYPDALGHTAQRTRRRQRQRIEPALL